MKKLKIIVVALIVAGVLGGAYGWFFVYNKPHRDYEKAKADYVLDATDCYRQYANGDSQAENYTGKVLEIFGKPSAIESNDSLVVVVFVFNEGLFGDEGLRCTMLEKFNDQALALNLEKGIKIKGYCTGYNDTDVVLINCSIINN